jgi:hypothetical protein
MPKIKTLFILLTCSYSLFFIALILWILSALKLPTIVFVYLTLVAASILSIIGTFKASNLLKGSFTKDQIKLIMVAFNVFIATIIIMVTTALVFHLF